MKNSEEKGADKRKFRREMQALTIGFHTDFYGIFYQGYGFLS